MTSRTTALDADPPPARAVLDRLEILRLYDRHNQALFRYAARRTGPVVAEDIVAEAFATAWRVRARFDPALGEPVGWLFGIARTLIAQHLRSDAYRLRAWMGSATRSDIADSDDLAERVSTRVDAQAASSSLNAAIAALPDEQRDALLLTVLGGLTPTEVATAQDVAPGAVRTRLHRARVAVRARLRAEGITAEGNDHV